MRMHSKHILQKCLFSGPCKGEEEGKRERQANVICRHRKWDSSGEMFEESQIEAVRDLILNIELYIATTTTTVLTYVLCTERGV